MDYFNEKERTKQEKFAKFRENLFNPVVLLLFNRKVTANQITYLGVLFLVIAVFITPQYYLLSAFFIGLYVISDGIDGPLARVSGKSHTGGSILDIWADQLGVVLLPAAAIYHFGASGVSAVLFSCGYIIFIILVVYGNELGIRSWRFIRVKYLFYALYIFCLAANKDWGMSIFMGIFAIYYWLEILLRIQLIYKFYDNEKL